MSHSKFILKANHSLKEIYQYNRGIPTAKQLKKERELAAIKRQNSLIYKEMEEYKKALENEKTIIITRPPNLDKSYDTPLDRCDLLAGVVRGDCYGLPCAKEGRCLKTDPAYIN